jgi:hypothetical protein
MDAPLRRIVARTKRVARPPLATSGMSTSKNPQLTFHSPVITVAATPENAIKASKHP